MVKITTGFRVLNSQYDRRNNLKVNLNVVFGGRSLFKGQNRADELFSYIEVSTVLIRNSEDPTF